MARPIKQQGIKQCITCGGEMIQPRWANGKLDSTFKNRKFCSIECSKLFALKSPAITPSAGRVRAQKMYTLKPCKICGNEHSQRHHVDGNPTNNLSENIMFLCQKCHVAEHVKEGTWGKVKQLTPTKCVICGLLFHPRKTRDKLCKSLLCSKEMGKISAERRWG